MLWDVNYTAIKKLTQRVHILPVRMLGGHREVSISQRLEFTSGVANHRGLAPKDCVTWPELGREEQTSSYSISGAGRKA